jgi:transposase
MKTRTQSQANVIMWNKVTNLSREERLNASKIAAKVGIDRRTVKRYLSITEQEFSEFIQSGRQYVRKLEPYNGFVKKLLGIDSELSAASIEDRLKEFYPDFPNVSSKTVYNFVDYVRRVNDIPKHVEVIRIYEKLKELEYGSEAQVDFGECWMTREGGQRKKIYFFAMVLCRSRYKYVRFQGRPYTGKDAVECHDMAFSYF